MRHGTLTAYHHHGCRCEDCTAAARTYEQNRRRQMAYGRWTPMVDADPVRAHVRALMAEGMGPKMIAATSGVPHGSISKLLYGTYGAAPRPPSRRVRRETADRLLSVQPVPERKAGGTLMPAHGTRRRLQALGVMGYSTAWIASRTNLGTAAVYRLRAGKVESCEVRTWRSVKALYREYAMRPAVGHHAARARTHARRLGWPSPLDWDDPDIADERLARGWEKSGPKECAS